MIKNSQAVVTDLTRTLNASSDSKNSAVRSSSPSLGSSYSHANSSQIINTGPRTPIRNITTLEYLKAKARIEASKKRSKSLLYTSKFHIQTMACEELADLFRQKHENLRSGAVVGLERKITRVKKVINPAIYTC